MMPGQRQVVDSVLLFGELLIRWKLQHCLARRHGRSCFLRHFSKESQGGLFDTANDENTIKQAIGELAACFCEEAAAMTCCQIERAGSLPATLTTDWIRRTPACGLKCTQQRGNQPVRISL